MVKNWVREEVQFVKFLRSLHQLQKVPISDLALFALVLRLSMFGRRITGKRYKETSNLDMQVNHEDQTCFIRYRARNGDVKEMTLEVGDDRKAEEGLYDYFFRRLLEMEER